MQGQRYHIRHVGGQHVYGHLQEEWYQAPGS